MSTATTPRRPTSRQVAFLEEYHLEGTDDFEIASQRIGAFLEANPDIAEHRRQNARAKRPAALAEQSGTPDTPPPPAAAPRRVTPTLDRYLGASRAEAAKKGVRPATESQVRQLLRLAYATTTSASQRINTLSALSGGVTLRQASVLIAKLQGTLNKKIAA